MQFLYVHLIFEIIGLFNDTLNFKIIEYMCIEFNNHNETIIKAVLEDCKYQYENIWKGILPNQSINEFVKIVLLEKMIRLHNYLPTC